MKLLQLNIINALRKENKPLTKKQIREWVEGDIEPALKDLLEEGVIRTCYRGKKFKIIN